MKIEPVIINRYGEIIQLTEAEIEAAHMAYQVALDLEIIKSSLDLLKRDKAIFNGDEYEEIDNANLLGKYDVMNSDRLLHELAVRYRDYIELDYADRDVAICGAIKSLVNDLSDMETALKNIKEGINYYFPGEERLITSTKDKGALCIYNVPLELADELSIQEHEGKGSWLKSLDAPDKVYTNLSPETLLDVFMPDNSFYGMPTSTYYNYEKSQIAELNLDEKSIAIHDGLELEKFFSHKGIIIYHIYKNDDPEEGTRTYAYATSPYGRDIPWNNDPANDTCFDVRELPFYKEPERYMPDSEALPLIKEAIKRGIDKGYITPKGLASNPRPAKKRSGQKTR